MSNGFGSQQINGAREAKDPKNVQLINGVFGFFTYNRKATQKH